jgi:hypothetical protein
MFDRGNMVSEDQAISPRGSLRAGGGGLERAAAG